MILVGEIRDAETARIAVQSALTGHLVLSSLHATDSVAALHRFLDMGIESFLVASSVVAVVGQRLVRRICDACKEPYTPRARGAGVLRGGGRQRRSTSSGTARAAPSAPAPASRTASASTSCSASRPRCAGSIVGWATQEELRRLAVSQGMRTLHAGGHRPRRERRHDHLRSHPHVLRELRSDHAASSRTSPSTRRAPPSRERARATRSATSARWLQAERAVPGQDREQQRSSSSSRSRKEKVKKRELMHFSPAARVFIRAGIPIITALETIADEAQDKVLRRVLADMVERSNTGSTFADAAAAHPEAFPAYYIGRAALGRADRRPRRDARQPRRVHRAGDRGAPKIIAALVYPGIVMVMAVVTIGVLAVVRAAAVQGLLRLARRRAAACHPDAARVVTLLSPTSGSSRVGIALDLRRSSCVWMVKTDARADTSATGRSCGCPVIGGDHPVRDPRALLPDPGDDESAGVPLPDAMEVTAESTNNTVYREQAGRGPAGDAARRGPRPAADRHRAVPRRRPPDDHGRRGDRHARRAARPMPRSTSTASSTSRSSASRALFEPATIIFVGVVVGFVAVALVPAMYGMLGGFDQ